MVCINENFISTLQLIQFFILKVEIKIEVSVEFSMQIG